jgi:lysophospholipase L1-like esterase
LPLIECQWHTPTMLGQVIEVQRAVAVRNQVAFFDTQQAMGGAEQMASFFAAEPKLAFADHVHFTKLGYQRWGELLLNELLASYAAAPAPAAATLPSVPADAPSAPLPSSSSP